MRGDILNRVRDAVLGVGDERPRLLVLIGLHRQRGVRLTSPVPDGRGFQHVAVKIHLQRQGVLDPRIGRIALVVVGDRLTRVRQEHRVPISAAGLLKPDAEVLLGDGIGMWFLCRAVKRIDILSQHRPFEGAAGFPLFC